MTCVVALGVCLPFALEAWDVQLLFAQRAFMVSFHASVVERTRPPCVCLVRRKTLIACRINVEGPLCVRLALGLLILLQALSVLLFES